MVSLPCFRCRVEERHNSGTESQACIYEDGAFASTDRSMDRKCLFRMFLLRSCDAHSIWNDEYCHR